MSGNMYDQGDVVLANIQFTDTFEIKKRPAVILFKEYDTLVVAGITSNTSMEGIPLLKKEGSLKDSVIKLNYIFTITSSMVEKKLFSLTQEKRKILFKELVEKLTRLQE